jgi:hypothetical protein
MTDGVRRPGGFSPSRVGRRAALCLVLAAVACGGGEKMKPPAHVELNTNLLRNSSFERGRGVTPDVWKLIPFAGDEKGVQVVHGIEKLVAHGGQRSFYLEGSRVTERWMALSQDVPIHPDYRVRVSGYMKTSDIHPRMGDPEFYCNLGLVFFDGKGKVIGSGKRALVGTRPLRGSQSWTKVSRTVEVPEKAVVVRLSCVLRGLGKAWFDDVSLEQLEPVPWVVVKKGPIEFHSLEGHELAQEDIDYVVNTFREYEKRLGASYDGTIGYYYYPDRETMQEVSGRNRLVAVDWSNAEIHTILPREDHDIIHLITEPWGHPPLLFVEGLAVHAAGQFEGRPIHALARKLLKEGRLHPVILMANDNYVRQYNSKDIWPVMGSFMSYLEDTYGSKKVQELYRAMHRVPGREAFERIFEDVLGSSVQDVEKRWHQYLQNVDPEGSRSG